LVVIAAPTHPLAGAVSIPMARLAREPLVVREPGSGTRAAFERHFSEHGLEYLPGCELNTNEAIKQSVQAGLGLGIVPLQTIDLELEARRLVVLPVEGFPLIRRWYIVHRCEKRLSAAALAFRELLLAQISVPAASASVDALAARSASQIVRRLGRRVNPAAP
jgi:DNA-binding transcriptional LysR family regulator